MSKLLADMAIVVGGAGLFTWAFFKLTEPPPPLGYRGSPCRKCGFYICEKNRRRPCA